MTAYYNENDPYAAQWLRNLIAAGHIALGEVDDRSIEDVCPDDLKGFTQCHFFAGIGGWSNALRLAGWPDDRPVWTGSCPCQPFSAASSVHKKSKKLEDERHLWPYMRDFIPYYRPEMVYMEQVESAIGAGWLDRVLGDMEDINYTWEEPTVLPAVCTSASHKRDRLWLALYPSGQRVGRPRSSKESSGFRQKWAYSPEDLQAIANAPFQSTERYPQPLICLDYDGIPARVVKARTKAIGNAIVPQVAAEYIESTMYENVF